MHRSFCRIHKKLRETPAIAAALADRLQSISDIPRVMEERAATVPRRAGIITALTRSIQRSATLINKWGRPCPRRGLLSRSPSFSVRLPRPMRVVFRASISRECAGLQKRCRLPTTARPSIPAWATSERPVSSWSKTGRCLRPWINHTACCPLNICQATSNGLHAWRWRWSSEKCGIMLRQTARPSVLQFEARSPVSARPGNKKQASLIYPRMRLDARTPGAIAGNRRDADRGVLPRLCAGTRCRGNVGNGQPPGSRIDARPAIGPAAFHSG
jgi:hypothetical protein